MNVMTRGQIRRLLEDVADRVRAEGHDEVEIGIDHMVDRWHMGRVHVGPCSVRLLEKDLFEGVRFGHRKRWDVETWGPGWNDAMRETADGGPGRIAYFAANALLACLARR